MNALEMALRSVVNDMEAGPDAFPRIGKDVARAGDQLDGGVQRIIRLPLRASRSAASSRAAISSNLS